MNILIAIFLSVAFVNAADPVNTTLDQIPDLASLPDSTATLQRQIDQSSGNLSLGKTEIYRITKPLVIDLARHRAISVKADAGATIVMDGPGPALRILGSHQGTAGPKSFKAATWHERMPILSGFEILGNHPEANGIELVQTVGAIVNKVSIRWCQHGIHLANRNRNVLISDCHLYENSGIGVYLDDVNLHQINIANSHISYNRQGGIVVRDGNVRNLQVSGCDIEANMPADTSPTRTANILIDVSGSPDTRAKSIAEVSITGCTIQHSANYGKDRTKTVALGGSNIRLAGKPIYPIDSVTITGNVLSDTTTNIIVEHSMDVAISANNFFAPKPTHLHVSDSHRVVVTGNTFNPRQFERPGTILFANSTNCIIANSTLHRFTTPTGALLLTNCTGMSINGLNLSDCASCIVLKNTTDSIIANCLITGTVKPRSDLDVDSSNQRIRLNGNNLMGKTALSKSAIK